MIGAGKCVPPFEWERREVIRWQRNQTKVAAPRSDTCPSQSATLLLDVRPLASTQTRLLNRKIFLLTEAREKDGLQNQSIVLLLLLGLAGIALNQSMWNG